MLIAVYETSGVNQEVFTTWATNSGLNPNAVRLPLVIDTEARRIHYIVVDPRDDSEQEREFPSGSPRSASRYMASDFPLPFVAEAVETGPRRAMAVLPDVSRG